MSRAAQTQLYHTLTPALLDLSAEYEQLQKPAGDVKPLGRRAFGDTSESFEYPLGNV